MAELTTPQPWLLAEFAHRANSDRSALPSGHKLNLVEVYNLRNIIKERYLLNGMAELATAHTWLLAANTHRVFAFRSALPSGR
jgi:hypothetical protein